MKQDSSLCKGTEVMGRQSRGTPKAEMGEDQLRGLCWDDHREDVGPLPEPQMTLAADGTQPLKRGARAGEKRGGVPPDPTLPQGL